MDDRDRSPDKINDGKICNNCKWLAFGASVLPGELEIELLYCSVDPPKHPPEPDQGPCWVRPVTLREWTCSRHEPMLVTHATNS